MSEDILSQCADTGSESCQYERTCSVTFVLSGPLAPKLLEVTPIAAVAIGGGASYMLYHGLMCWRLGPISISAPQSVSRYAIVRVHVCIDSTGVAMNAGCAPAGWRSCDQDGGSQV